MDTDIKNDLHLSRVISVLSLYELDGSATLYKIHNQSKKRTNNGLKIESIFWSLKSLDDIVEFDDDPFEDATYPVDVEEKSLSSDIIAEITSEEEAETIIHYYQQTIA